MSDPWFRGIELVTIVLQRRRGCDLVVTAYTVLDPLPTLRAPGTRIEVDRRRTTGRIPGPRPYPLATAQL